MRGDIWTFTDAGATRRPWVIVQAEALNEVSPTVIAAALTFRPQQAAEPLVVALDRGAGGLERQAWVKVTHLRTLVATDAHERVGALTRETRERVDAALAEVLGLSGAGSGAVR